MPQKPGKSPENRSDIDHKRNWTVVQQADLHVGAVLARFYRNRQRAEGAHEFFEQDSALFIRSGQREARPPALVGVPINRKVAHRKQSRICTLPTKIQNGEVHLSVGVIKNPEIYDPLSELCRANRIIFFFYPDEKKQTGATPADDFSIDHHRSIRNTLHDCTHPKILPGRVEAG